MSRSNVIVRDPAPYNPRQILDDAIEWACARCAADASGQTHDTPYDADFGRGWKA